MRKKIALPVAVCLIVAMMLSFAGCKKQADGDGLTEPAEVGTTASIPAPTDVVSVSETTEPETTVQTTAEATAASTKASTTAVTTTSAPTATAPATEAPDVNTGSFSSSDMAVTVKGVRMRPNTKWSSYASALGTAQNVVQAPSCHFDGMDNIYEYGGFSVYTYQNNGEEYVYDIEISSSSYATDKGIKVGSSADSVLAAYGNGYASMTGSMIEYRSGSQSLYFSLNGNTVSMIEFYCD